MTEQRHNPQIETKVAILEHDIKQMGGLFSRLDDAIEKMGDVSSCINKMLAVHEEKIAQNSADTGDLFNLVEKRRLEQDDATRELHSRITTQQREIKEELREDYDRLSGSLDEIKTLLRSAMKEADEEMRRMEQRVQILERKQWLIMGAAIVGGFILGNLEIFKSFIG